ncbi:MAG: glycerol-3-phosphate dehydrogenase/oxidase [Actinobacteria bacterium]|nr:glycerol-3-phosphate dehydrogenase/oxidase [Actinomycetota bacterium]
MRSEMPGIRLLATANSASAVGWVALSCNSEKISCRCGVRRRPCARYLAATSSGACTPGTLFAGFAYLQVMQTRSRRSAVTPHRQARTSRLCAVKRAAMLSRLRSEPFDLLVVGGGITGAGVALDAAARGLRVALVDQSDFASGTSSKSSKLIHGGLRYLQQGDIALVYEALFMIPVMTRDGVVSRKIARALGSALWMYDLTGGWRVGKLHRRLRAKAALAHMPTMDATKLSSAYLYFDAEADDARLTLAIIRSAIERGAIVANYCGVTAMRKDDAGHIVGASVATRDGEAFDISARVVVNATGVWGDALRRMDVGGRTITRDDVVGTWAGLRPLVVSADGAAAKGRTADLSRRHKVMVSDSGMITITGGKLTTYRKMAEHTVDEVQKALSHRGRCSTKRLQLFGATSRNRDEHLVSRFGTEAEAVRALIAADPSLGAPLVAGLPYVRAEAVYSARHEMVVTLDDVLSRRTRGLLYDRDATLRAAAEVAELIAPELGWNAERVTREVQHFSEICQREVAAAR